MSAPHTVSQTNFTKNHNLYDKVRPSYNEETVQTIIKVANIHEGSVVIDMAAGTGKFTGALLKYAPKCKIIAVEPSPGMLASYSKNFPDIRTIEAPASHVPQLEDGIADVIVVAQAFHWFATSESLKEFHRLLKPGGTLVLTWNADDTETASKDAWQYNITHYCWAKDVNVPQYRHNKWSIPFDDQGKGSPELFGPLNKSHIQFQLTVPNQQYLWQLWESRSYITALEEPTKTEFKTGFFDILKRTNAPEENLVAHVANDVVWTKRLE